jgi:hypothetical protein
MNPKIFPAKTQATQKQFQSVQKRFAWRETRIKQSPIPEALWDAAAGLAEHYSINQIASVLGLNHTALKNRIFQANSRPSAFKYAQCP